MTPSARAGIGIYVPGTTVLHRTPAGVKLLFLVAAAAVVAVLHGWVASLTAFGVAVGLLAWAGAGPRMVARSIRGLLVMAVLLGAWQVWQSGWPRAVETVGDLLALALLATVLTVTTRVDDLLDAITRGLRPFRVVGVNAEKVALAFSLTIRTIPLTADLAREAQQAASARGLERSFRARLVPFVIRAVAHAHATGAALHARGLADD